VIREVIITRDNFSAINAIIILYFLRWVLHFHSSGLLGLVRFQALVLRFLLLLFLLGGGLVLTLFQRLFALLGGFVGLAPRIDRYLRPALGGGGNVFRLHLVGGFALCAGLYMTVELNALAVL